MFYDFTPEELRDIQNFVENNESISSETIDRFMALSFATMKKVRERLYSAKEENFRLKRRIDRYEKKEKGDGRTAPAFSETGCDSADIAEALIFCLRELKTYQLSKPKVMLILYEMYASWLASKRQRLFVEHPVANEWGPQFWRAYKRTDPKTNVPRAAFNKVASQNPGVAAFIRNAAAKYYDYSLSDLKNLFVNSEPYRNALPSTNGGKWGKEITDSDIYLWKTSQK